MRFKTYSFKDLAIIKYGKNQKKVLSENGKIPIYGTGGLMGFATDSLYDKPSVLIGRKGTIGKVKFVKNPFWTVDTLFYTIVNEEIVIPKFLYYIMSQLDLNLYNEGTTIPSLRTETLNRLEFDIPSIELQRQILGYLSIIDEKIELNNRINENLEQQAQALFKSWFVDIDIIPSNWKSATLGSIATIKTSSFNPLKNDEILLEHYSIPAYDKKHYPVFESSLSIKSNKYILSTHSVMISKLNPDTKRIWRPLCLSAHSVCSTEFIVYEANNAAYKDFIYSIIDSNAFSNYLCSHTTGSTNSRQRATPKDTLYFQFFMPPAEKVIEFCGLVSPLYNLMGENIAENQSLAKLRDTLLPKLMSGEIDVSNVTI